MLDIDYDPVTTPEEEEERKRRMGDYPPVDARPMGPPVPPDLKSSDEVPVSAPSLSVPSNPHMLDSLAIPSPSKLPVQTPAQSRLRKLTDQGAPPVQPLHGWRKGLDVLSNLSWPTQQIAQSLRGRPQREYAQNLKQAESDVTGENLAETEQQKLNKGEADVAHTKAETEALENPQPKVGQTPEEQFMNDALHGDNGKPRLDAQGNPYVYLTAHAAWKQSEQGVKPEKTLNDFEQFYKDYIRDNNLPDSAHNRLMARKEFATAGQAPERPQRVLMMVPQADGSQKAVEVTPGMTVAGNAAKPGDAAKVSTQDKREHDKAYVQPAEATEQSYQMMDHAYQQYKAAKAQGKELPTGAESMVALSTHLSTTFGNVKGARVTKDMIEHHLGARGISDSATVAVQKLTNGDVLSPDQWEAFHELIQHSRNLKWQTAVKEAERKHIPVDFLPQGMKPEDVKNIGSGSTGGIPAGATATHQDGTKWKFKGGDSSDIKNWEKI